MDKKDIRIVFMGTPSFAVPSLDALHQSGYDIVGVVTAPDRKSGRGQKIKYSSIKDYALANGLKILQPENLKDERFINELRSLKANLQVVVAFRMLPRIVWDMPELGTFNLHASLLPQYRGAAPINHAIINGESKTGLTTFFLDQNIDTGKIIKQVPVTIGSDEDAGQLHDRMMLIGANLVIKTVETIQSDELVVIPQEKLLETENHLIKAPKISKTFCRVDWNTLPLRIYNFIRGLSPYPGAYSFLRTVADKEYLIKILKCRIESTDLKGNPGQILTDQKTYLKVFAINGMISITELQIEGKKRMQIDEFLRGFNMISEYTFL